MGLKKKKKRFRGYSHPEAETVTMDGSKSGGLMKFFLVAQILFAVALAVKVGDRSPTLSKTDEHQQRNPVSFDAGSRELVKEETPTRSTPGVLRRSGTGHLQNRPVIGVVTQPLFTVDSSAENELAPYIAASYVKMVEAAGARPAVIFHNSTDDELNYMFKRVNAILFPGGRGGRHGHLDEDAPYLKIGKKIIRMAEAANDAGDYFSLHFTCLGFEVLFSAVAGSCKLMQPTDAQDLPSSLDLDWTAVRESKMFATRGVINGSAYAELLGGKEPLAANYHTWGLLAQDFHANKVLSAYFSALSTSRDRAGLAYISTMEARAYPFFGTQWHPEKNAFEWNPAFHIPHSPDAVAVSNFYAQLLGSEARRSSHAFETEEALNAALVYNWPPIFSAEVDPGHFEELYVFA